jgi:negative regulator of sigma E activity
MKKENYQKISQFLDAELQLKELESILQQIKQHPEIKDTLTRYQIASHVLSKEESADILVANKHFLKNINQQLEQEPHYLLPKQTLKKHRFGVWQKTSLAVAASVAIISVVMVSRQADMQNLQTPQKTILIAQKPVAKVKDQLESNEALKLRPSQHERLKAYLQAHSDDIYTYGSLSTPPHGQVASFGQE